MTEFRTGFAELAGRWQQVAGISFLVGNLAVATFGGALNSCSRNGDEGSKPKTPAASPSGVAPEDENMITCGEIKHLRVDESSGRVLTIAGTEITVGLHVSRGALNVDQGNDGTVEHTLVPGGQDAQLVFSERDIMGMTFSYNDDPVRPFGIVGVVRGCTK